MDIEHTQESLITQIVQLARRFQIVDVYVFGSRAKEIVARVKEEKYSRRVTSSDVDIGIRPQRDIRLGPRDLVNITAELEDIFDAKRVDLILLPKADPFLALDIIRGELLYTKDAEDQARYELFVLRRAGDLLPLKKERINMILRGHGR